MWPDRNQSADLQKYDQLLRHSRHCEFCSAGPPRVLTPSAGVKGQREGYPCALLTSDCLPLISHSHNFAEDHLVETRARVYTLVHVVCLNWSFGWHSNLFFLVQLYVTIQCYHVEASSGLDSLMMSPMIGFLSPGRIQAKKQKQLCQGFLFFVFLAVVPQVTTSNGEYGTEKKMILESQWAIN